MNQNQETVLSQEALLRVCKSCGAVACDENDGANCLRCEDLYYDAQVEAREMARASEGIEPFGEDIFEDIFEPADNEAGEAGA